ncbi:TIGR03435 family protein [Granulicella paludicola]|uniref:TIGR03435 family protein n=1 Tax=Granulicella paludicola TaxID=474951 RepID=UPI0021E0DC0E|nr:TIGR03435 family protein [Granulicella paludicola]
MRFHRAGMVLALSLSVAGGVAQVPADAAKTAIPNAVFDVSTMKPNHSEDGSVNVNWGENTYTAKNVQVDSLLSVAFGVREDLITGLPAWAKSMHFDIVAKATELDPETVKKLTREQRRELMQGMILHLLEERFHVKTHTEMKELPVYDLVIAKGGIKFDGAGKKLGVEGCKGWMMSSDNDMKLQCVPIDMLASNLEYRAERTIIDKTGLPKDVGYDMELKWRRETEGAASDADLQLPTLFDALQEQLGLKLESSKGPVKTLVVDQMEKPTEN